MYEAYFKFTGRPFATVPKVKEYFPAATIEAARQTLLRCLQRGEGIGLVIGPSGTGKTLLCDVLDEQLGSVFGVAKLSCGRLSTRSALFQTILYELGRPYRQMDEGELRLALVDFLTVGTDRPNGLVLLADEAHHLPLRLIEEIRMLTNLAMEGEPVIRLVLVGAPALEERLAHPKLESFSQRVVSRCYLESFTRSETEEYICAQIAAVGGHDNIFPNEAQLAVHQATDGVPRLINQVCDHALLMVYANGGKALTALGVEEAWADLQQLPTPWNGETAEQGGAGVIEFGGLDDDEDTSDATPDLRVAAVEDEATLEPEQDIENIQETLDKLEEEFVPVGSIGPEVTIAFEADPFAESFEDEEVVVDRYTAPDNQQESSTEFGTLEDVDSAEDVGSEATSQEEVDNVETVPMHDEQRASDDMIVVEDACDAIEMVSMQSIPKVRKQEYRNLFAKLRQG